VITLGKSYSIATGSNSLSYLTFVAAVITLGKSYVVARGSNAVSYLTFVAAVITLGKSYNILALPKDQIPPPFFFYIIKRCTYLFSMGNLSMEVYYTVCGVVVQHDGGIMNADGTIQIRIYQLL
jgi:hypothetical protein